MTIAGCSIQSTGSAQSVTTGRNQASSVPSAEALHIFDTMNACTMLDDILSGQGFKPGENKTARNECHASKTQYGAVAIALDPVQGMAEFRKTDPSAVETQINGRPALRSYRPADACDIAMKVAENARAIIGTTITQGYGRDACAEAKKYAKQLEPMLPKVQ
ncbi:DUF3558 domain-containing protein [Amycolatopsis aidingensis]|uniref:DUF3558 family protein n=1 Tax=Amycolatopsis aidingensis TaxID=2842453 RepID=UPI001C0D6B1C|nr:DUF3558 family protein [Amycolatopsis aidingensis]